jgi:hypothetical protein
MRKSETRSRKAKPEAGEEEKQEGWERKGRGVQEGNGSRRFRRM